MSWRDKARPIIGTILRDLAGADEAEIKKALRDAYPFGERRYHPYKIWLDEIRLQRGLRKTQEPDPRQGTIPGFYWTSGGQR